MQMERERENEIVILFLRVNKNVCWQDHTYVHYLPTTYNFGDNELGRFWIAKNWSLIQASFERSF